MTRGITIVDVGEDTDGVVVVLVDVQVQLASGSGNTMDQEGIGACVWTGKNPGSGVVAIAHV